MACFIMVMTFVTSSIVFALIGYKNAWGGGPRPEWNWYIGPMSIALFMITIVFFSRKFNNKQKCEECAPPKKQ